MMTAPKLGALIAAIGLLSCAYPIPELWHRLPRSKLSTLEHFQPTSGNTPGYSHSII